jgi:transketolase
MAMGHKLSASPARVYTLMGDGELAEAPTGKPPRPPVTISWTTSPPSSTKNGLQIGGPSDSIMNYEPLQDRWASFGWSVRRIDGHDYPTIVQTLESLPFEKGKPSLIIADTVKSKGFPFAEGKAAYHYWKATKEELQLADEALAAARAGLEKALAEAQVKGGL